MIPISIFWSGMNCKTGLFVLCCLFVQKTWCQPDEFAKTMEAAQQAQSQFLYRDAIKWYEKAISLNERSVEAHIGLANSLLQSSSPGIVNVDLLQRANREELRALELAPNNAEALAGQAEIEYRLGFGLGPALPMVKLSSGITAARDLLARALAANPNNYHARYQLALIASDKAEREMMLAASAAGWRSSQDGVMSDSVKETVRQQCSPALEEAMDLYKKAISVNPNGYRAMLGLARVYRLRSNLEAGSAAESDAKLHREWMSKGDVVYARMLREASEKPESLSILANSGTFDEAMAAGRQAIDSYNYENAVRAYGRAVQLNDRSPEAHVQLANALILTSVGTASKYPFDPERIRRAVEEENRALKLSPGNAEAMAGLARAEYAFGTHSNPSDGSEHVETAREWARKALAVDPVNFHANYLLAHIEYQEFAKADFEARSQAYRDGERGNQISAKYVDPLRRLFGSSVEEGIRFAEKAVEARPDSAQASLELANLYSARAQLNPEAAKADEETAGKWRIKALQLAKRENRETGMTSGWMGGVMGGILSAAPPPPPPVMQPANPLPLGPGGGIGSATRTDSMREPGVYRIGGGITPPQLIYKRDPGYAEPARQAKLQGVVVLSIVVTAEGTVTSPKIVRSLGLGLDEKAIEAVQQWKFVPAKKNGQPVAAYANVEVNFRLLNDPEKN